MDPMLSHALVLLAGYLVGWILGRQHRDRWAFLYWRWTEDELVEKARKYERRHDITMNQN